jgi:hypothetical protein
MAKISWEDKSASTKLVLEERVLVEEEEEAEEGEVIIYQIIP